MGRRHSGLTLVELLVALVLASMLIALLFAVVGQLSRSQAAMKERYPFAPWKAVLASQLQADYRRSHSVLVREKELRLAGNFQFIDSQGEFREGPFLIRYIIVSEDDGNWLYREQVERLDLKSSTIERELVCKNVVAFESSEQLSTDVAPGVLQLSISTIENGTDKAPTGTEAKRWKLVLIRHGGIEP